MLWLCLYLLAVGVVVFFLYSRGIAVSKSIRAILYIFYPGKNTDRVTLESCTGWTRHVGRFCESRVYEFAFHGHLTRGNVDVILLDKKKRQLLKLNQQNPAGKVEVDKKKQYYLLWEYYGATGKCELSW